MALIATDTAASAVVPYGTPEWVRERIGCLTASNMAKVVSTLKNGGETAERRKLRMQILAERMADCATDHYVTPEMQWGIDNEPQAIAAYVELSGATLLKGGFVRHPTIQFFGATPDAFVYPDGLLECKCPRTETHLGYMLAGVVPEDYRPQMLAQLACTGRRWCDFISFDPRIQKKDKQAFVRRFEPKAAEIEAIEDAARKFLAEVEQMWEQMNS